MVKINAAKQNTEKRMKRNEASKTDLWDSIKCTNICIEVPEGKEKKGQQTYLKKFHYPEQFARINGEIRSMCYKPDRDPNR